MTRPVPSLVLASVSPRRSQILQLLGLEHSLRAPDSTEDLADGEPPDQAALRLAVRKVRSVRADDGELLLAADTLVAVAGLILGKPGGTDEAVEMLRSLAGREHVVHTALALSQAGKVEAGVASTRVWFRALARRDCEEYVASGEPLDKAGAYGIQGLGAALVERIEGEYFNVMGLPVQLLLSLLRRFGLRYAFGRLDWA